MSAITLRPIDGESVLKETGSTDDLLAKKEEWVRLYSGYGAFDLVRETPNYKVWINDQYIITLISYSPPLSIDGPEPTR